MDYEICRDRTGWTWKMPYLDWDIAEKFGLGTFDLADWVWGTRAEPEEIFWLDESYLHILTVAKPFWRMENWLRFWEWNLLFTRGEGLPYKAARALRRLTFKLAWIVHGFGYWLEEVIP